MAAELCPLELEHGLQVAHRNHECLQEKPAKRKEVEETQCISPIVKPVEIVGVDQRDRYKDGCDSKDGCFLDAFEAFYFLFESSVSEFELVKLLKRVYFLEDDERPKHKLL